MHMGKVVVNIINVKGSLRSCFRTLSLNLFSIKKLYFLFSLTFYSRRFRYGYEVIASLISASINLILSLEFLLFFLCVNDFNVSWVNLLFFNFHKGLYQRHFSKWYYSQSCFILKIWERRYLEDFLNIFPRNSNRWFSKINY